MVFIFLYSTMIKAYREDVLNNFDQDVFQQKFDEFAEKFKEVQEGRESDQH